MRDFIYRGNISHDLCDKIIEYHKNSKEKNPGLIIGTSEQGISSRYVDKKIKDSIDIMLDSNADLYLEYTNQLQKNINTYIEIFPSCNYYSPCGVNEPINIQYYPPGGGYKVWHTERGTAKGVCSTRHLVFMTYLNDVTDGGGTQFLNQNLTVDAKKGLTLMWPADWTYTHKGVVSPSQEKYIVTGWLNYLELENANV